MFHRRQNRHRNIACCVWNRHSHTCTSWKARRSPWIHCWGAYWFLSVPALRRWYGRSFHPPHLPGIVLLGPPLRYPTTEARDWRRRKGACGIWVYAMNLLTGRIVSAGSVVFWGVLANAATLHMEINERRLQLTANYLSVLASRLSTGCVTVLYSAAGASCVPAYIQEMRWLSVLSELSLFRSNITERTEK